jgi:hypothetical protein
MRTPRLSDGSRSFAPAPHNGGYDKRSLPPVEFKYSEAIVQGVVGEVSPQSLENLLIDPDGIQKA